MQSRARIETETIALIVAGLSSADHSNRGSLEAAIFHQIPGAPV